MAYPNNLRQTIGLRLRRKRIGGSAGGRVGVCNSPTPVRRYADPPIRFLKSPFRQETCPGPLMLTRMRLRRIAQQRVPYWTLFL
jgi:hypothetical protein